MGVRNMRIKTASYESLARERVRPQHMASRAAHHMHSGNKLHRPQWL